MNGNINVAKADLLDRLWFNKPIRICIREFAAVFSLIAALVAAWFIYKHESFKISASLITFAVVLMSIGYRKPLWLYPIWRGWMSFAQKLGHVVSLIIISIAWFIMLVPIAFLLRILKIKVMDMSYEPARESYWEERSQEEDNFKKLERQF